MEHRRARVGPGGFGQFGEADAVQCTSSTTHPVTHWNRG